MNIAELIEAARAAGTFLRASNARGVDFDFANFFLFLLWAPFRLSTTTRARVALAPGPLSYGHTTVKAPHPIRTAKLSTVGLVQYFGRGL